MQPRRLATAAALHCRQQLQVLVEPTRQLEIDITGARSAGQRYSPTDHNHLPSNDNIKNKQ